MRKSKNHIAANITYNASSGMLFTGLSASAAFTRSAFRTIAAACNQPVVDTPSAPLGFCKKHVHGSTGVYNAGCGKISVRLEILRAFSPFDRERSTLLLVGGCVKMVQSSLSKEVKVGLKGRLMASRGS